VAKDLYDIGEIPPVGEVPGRMYAQVIRPERFGEPEYDFQVEDPSGEVPPKVRDLWEKTPAGGNRTYRNRLVFLAPNAASLLPCRA
jgi:hypothetical protein